MWHETSALHQRESIKNQSWVCLCLSRLLWIFFFFHFIWCFPGPCVICTWIILYFFLLYCAPAISRARATRQYILSWRSFLVFSITFVTLVTEWRAAFWRAVNRSSVLRAWNVACTLLCCTANTRDNTTSKPDIPRTHSIGGTSQPDYLLPLAGKDKTKLQSQNHGFAVVAWLCRDRRRCCCCCCLFESRRGNQRWRSMCAHSFVHAVSLRIEKCGH